MNVSIHNNAYALMNQVVIIRDTVNAKIQGSVDNSIGKNNITMYSFFSQDEIGDIMIHRHRLLLTYIDMVASKYPEKVGVWASDINDELGINRKQLLSKLVVYDQSLNKKTSFNMHIITMYTISMIDKMFDNNYDGSLLAVKGILMTVH